ncbi:Uma2 family endonuclease [Streptomyces sp. APSN-46.1]|uniref:Uma2 family endonuclease n=1 Tax=Streptomyces sp. APSN-46.1 TaxID=2929049 RepID=UPI001FB4A70B|nr:Uma2 family endonuclease [Streptomyces sp. APSN-46.1]MCJ1678066.1 Uma2 family endonuclease [Streptomyces sp. APSN-46.1]
MTARTGRPHLLTEEFEELALMARNQLEGVRLEFIDGRLRSKAPQDGDHGTIIEWLTRICMRYRPELWSYPGRGIKVQEHRAGRAIPDASLAPSEAFAGEGEWSEPEPVLMVVEVASWDSDTDHRNRRESPRVYAETGIPVYLLIDRHTCEVLVYSDPDGQRYETVRTVPYGKDIHLPDPVGITLHTEPLKDWVR